MLSFERAVEAVESALRAQANEQLVAPPRFNVPTPDGALVFTAGAETFREHVIGFRAYDTFHNELAGHEQLTAVFDARTGVFKGLVIGKALGALRTAAINAVAVKHMARQQVGLLGVLGTGFQAGYHLEAALAVRDPKRVVVYSPNPDHRKRFAERMTAKLGRPVEAAAEAKAAVREADVLLCCTASPTPVFDAAWLRPGVHVNTIGPKFHDAHELPLEAAEGCHCLATDSLAQVEGFSKPFFLEGTPQRGRLVELCQIVAGKRAGRTANTDQTLFCSVGLAGTEVVIANEALKHA